MRAAADVCSSIEMGEDYASFRAVFADEIGVKFVAETDDAAEEILEQLREPVFELVRFAEAALLAQLKRAPLDATELWNPGDERPSRLGGAAGAKAQGPYSSGQGIATGDADT
jgi:hypothetical protein